MDKKFDELTIEEKIASINAEFEKTNKAVSERCAYRAENYYNCIDDYSEYGPCYKADMAELNSAEKYRDLRIEEVKGDGYHREVSERYALLNSAGEVVATEVSKGQYGRYWYDTVNNCYVGVPKKISTLVKKGYTLAKIENVYDCKVSDVTLKMQIRNSSMKLVSSTTTVLTEIPEYMTLGTAYCEWQYDTFFNKAA